MELEIGKRYHIKPVVVSPCLLSEGDYIVSHGGYSLGLRFQVTGDSIKEARPVSSYTFTRLPSFGDEVEVRRPSSVIWEYWYYLGESPCRFFLGFSDNDDGVNNIIDITCESKTDTTINLITPAPETTNVLGKTYLTTDVEGRMAELTPLGD